MFRSILVVAGELLMVAWCYGQTLSTVAGTYIGDGSPAKNGVLSYANGMHVDSAGNIYIADTYYDRIRKIDAKTGIITTVAGNGLRGFSGDGGLATHSALNQPSGVYVDESGNIYIVDTTNRIRKVDTETGIIRRRKQIKVSSICDC